MDIPFDVSGLLPAAQPVAHAVAQVYWKHTHPWFVGLLCFGSVAKGSIIPGASDIDFHLYLEDAAFTSEGTLPLELCLRIHRDMAQIDPAPLRYIDGGIERVAPLEEGHVGPVPGAYRLIAGRLPIPEATAQDLREQAYWSLSRLVPIPPFLTEGLLHHGQSHGQLALTLRMFSQRVWPVLFQVLCLQQDDPLAVWCLPKEQAVKLLAQDSMMGQQITTFDAAVRAYYPTESSLEQALAIICHGVAFLEAARAWARQRCG